MSGVADKVQIDEVISGQNPEDWKAFTSDKNVSYVVDQQNGNYSNQVSWDLTSIVNQNAWMSLQESYILMPFSTTVTFGTAQTNPISSKFLCLKDNFINYVDSIQFFVNGQQLIDQTTYSNFPLQVIDKLVMSQDDLSVKGSSLNIQPDTTTSVRFNNQANSGGDGYRNNLVQVPYTAGAATVSSTAPIVQDTALVNQGSTKRLLNTWDPTTIDAPPAMASAASNLGAKILAPYFSSDGNTKKSGVWNYVVYLPLKRIADLLSKYPLVKGSQMRLVINFNASIVPITIGATTPATYQLTTNPTLTAGNTVTPLVSDSKLGLGYVSTGIPAVGIASTCTITTAIQTSTVAYAVNTTAAKGFGQLPNCRIYVPSYKVNPTYEERMLSNRKQVIKYIDWYQQPIIGVAAGSSFSQTLTTALPNVNMLIMIPFQSGTTEVFTTATCNTFQSPFDTAPATSMPGGMLAFQNFNVSISGQNVYNQNQNYTFDNWAQEVQKLGVNGGLSREISSGLLGLNEWIYSPYVITDISRREESANNTYQSVVVNGTNNSSVKVDYYCFIGFQKEIEIDVLTGQVNKLF